MKDLAHKKKVLADIMKFADEMELEPLKKKKTSVAIEIEPEEAPEEEAAALEEGEEDLLSPADKVRQMVEGKEEKEESDEEDLDDETKAKLMELYASLKD